MTAVAPRPVVPSSPSAAAVPNGVARPADRSDGYGGRDFEAVLRGHGGSDADTRRPGQQERDAHVATPRHSSPEHADRTSAASSRTAAVPADPARPSADPAAQAASAPATPSGAPAATPTTPGAPSPAVGAPVTADATTSGAPARGPALATATPPTPVAPAATPARAREGAATVSGQPLATADQADARTTPVPAGGASPGAVPATGPAAPVGRLDGVAGAPPAPGVAAAATAPAATATGPDRAADPGVPAVDPGTTPTGTGGTVDGAPAYALAPIGAAPTGTGTPVVSSADARPAQPALPPQAQVLNAVSPLLTTADGTHRLTVHLAPAHLGSVQVHLEVRGGEVTVRLTAVDPATGDALRQGTPELRSHLERIGLRSGGIDVQVAAGDPTRESAGGGAATADRGSRDKDPREAIPWAGPDGTGGETARDGAWQRHGRPLEGWTPRADGPRPARDTPGAPDQLDPHRPRPLDARVDVRM